jgi:hypothetical protein
MFFEIPREYLSGNWLYWSNLSALRTDSFLLFSFFLGRGSSGYEGLFKGLTCGKGGGGAGITALVISTSK